MARFGVVHKPQTEITAEKLKKLFPSKKGTVTEDVVEYANESMNNPFFDGDEFMDSLLTYRDVLEGHKVSLKDYMTAIKFCAYLEAEDYNNTEAFKKAHAHTDFVKARLDSPTNSKEYRELTSAASRYRARPVVKQILTQAQVGLFLMYQGETFRAMNVLIDIAQNGRSEMARVAACKEILVNVKPPETKKIELDIGIREGNALESLNDQLMKFATVSLNQLTEGNIELKTLGSMKAIEDEEEIIDVNVE